jgi:hypothetical protein
MMPVSSATPRDSLPISFVHDERSHGAGSRRCRLVAEQAGLHLAEAFLPRLDLGRRDAVLLLRLVDLEEVEEPAAGEQRRSSEDHCDPALVAHGASYSSRVRP